MALGGQGVSKNRSVYIKQEVASIWWGWMVENGCCARFCVLFADDNAVVSELREQVAEVGGGF